MVKPTSSGSVVFVCEHGSAKSVVAAAHFNRLAAERGLAIRAISRGTVPDEEMAKPAVEGLLGDGLVPGDATPSRLQQGDLDAATRVVTFCDLPPESVPKSTVARWEVPPVSTDYSASRDAIVRGIDQLIGELGRDQCS